MRVLCLGQSRTGTSSAKAALERLGFQKTYDYFNFMQPDSDARFWRRAMDIKHQEDRLITRSEWDELLGEYAAVTDNPCCYFSEDLIAAYPDARVVLQSRELEAWANSWIDTIARCLHDPVVKYLYTFDKDMVRWVPLTTEIHETYMGIGFRRGTLIAEHKLFREQVRGLVPKGRGSRGAISEPI